MRPDEDEDPTEPIRAAQYLRKSTHHQQYSTALQASANQAYAAGRGMIIVRTYADEGKSGIGIEGRDALKRMIGDVQSGTADFTDILVYDVSRWGRFQDIDESGYYEYLCKRAGVRVHYCAELFPNDGSVFSIILKNIKRAMAGEFSRELSAKVFAGHARLVTYGYSQGGAPSYGLRRLLVDREGGAKFELRFGERKHMQTDRVVWIPGAPEEVDHVRFIFEAFVEEGKTEPELARMLNGRGSRTAKGNAWTPHAVRRVLGNERYIGNYVWNRVSRRLRAPPARNAPDKWIRAEAVIPPIVPRRMFDAARDIMRRRGRKLTDEEKLEPLRRLLRKHGRLSHAIIRDAPDAPSIGSYYRWFGGLIPAYRLVGFTGYRPYARRERPPRSKSSVTARLSDDRLLGLLRGVLKANGFLNHRVINAAEGVPHATTYAKRFGSSKRAYRLAGFSGDHEHSGGAGVREARRALTSVQSDAQMLKALRRVLRKHGKLTRKIIDGSGECPSSATYLNRFGSMAHAYRLIRYRPGSHQRSCMRTRALSNRRMLDKLREVLRKRGSLTPTLIDRSKNMPSSDTYRRRFGSVARAFALIGYEKP